MRRYVKHTDVYDSLRRVLRELTLQGWEQPSMLAILLADDNGSYRAGLREQAGLYHYVIPVVNHLDLNRGESPPWDGYFARNRHEAKAFLEGAQAALQWVRESAPNRR